MNTLKCIQCGTEYPLYPLRSSCEKCGGTLDYRGDLPDKAALNLSGQGFWKYKPLLPPIEHMVSLGEGATPLHKADRLAKTVGLKSFF